MSEILNKRPEFNLEGLGRRFAKEFAFIKSDEYGQDFDLLFDSLKRSRESEGVVVMKGEGMESSKQAIYHPRDLEDAAIGNNASRTPYWFHNELVYINNYNYPEYEALSGKDGELYSLEASHSWIGDERGGTEKIDEKIKAVYGGIYQLQEELVKSFKNVGQRDRALQNLLGVAHYIESLRGDSFLFTLKHVVKPQRSVTRPRFQVMSSVSIAQDLKGRVFLDADYGRRADVRRGMKWVEGEDVSKLFGEDFEELFGGEKGLV